MNEMKVLVANRGEISVRICRAAHELSMSTVAIYSEQDRLAGHRQIADVSYKIDGPGGIGPVEAYLDGGKIIEIGLTQKVDFIHPGYGFLAENASFAKAVAKAGIVFIGPPPEVIDMMGNKITARGIAQECGIPIVPGATISLENAKEVKEFIQLHGYPVVLKANFGGGGRGIRVLNAGDSVENAMAAARSEAAAAFGDGSLFVEKYLSQPKHIEVQVLADKFGNCVHLFERDCSVQRKHQKILEIAPAPTLSTELRQSMHEAAVKLAKHIHYQNAGTVEFLVEKDRFYFIEMNPRIQVEHTITEEITGVDLVKSQLQIAAGKSLPEIGLTQNKITQHGVAIQCRVTTEVPAQDFRPDTGMINFCRLPTGHGIRLDYSDCFLGATISPFYDSLLVKCVVHAPNMREASQKAVRALKEIRIGGVETNIHFLLQIMSTKTFSAGACWTTFIHDNPSLTELPTFGDVGQKYLYFLADTAVNGTRIAGQVKPPGLIGEISAPQLFEHDSNKVICTESPSVEGWRSVILQSGPKEFARRIRAHPATLITDTTWRDGQQSLLATRVRTRDFAKIATTTSHAYKKAYSLECWGGATFDVAMRFLHEDPWERLRLLRKLVPNVPFQMLLRSTSGVAYSAFPDNAIFHFIKNAKRAGIDIFRVFDSLNNLDNLKVGIDAVLEAGGVVEGAILYTGDMLKKGCKYNLEYYMALVEKLVRMGAHIIAIKSMSGVMKPSAGRALVREIRAKFPDIPIHMHTHDNNGAGVATMMACVEEGADIVDTAIDSISGSTSQPAISSMLATLEDTAYKSELSLDQTSAVDKYWAQLRLMYSGFDADLRSPDPTIYKHEIPGGQYSNLLFQARQNGLGAKWDETLEAYERANHLLGDIIKATPTSKAVGDLAQFIVDHNLSSDDIIQKASTLDFPASVLDFFEGLMGQPFDGFPEPLRTNILGSRRQKLSSRPGATMEPINFENIRELIHSQFPDRVPSDYDIASYVMYPDVYREFREARQKYGDLTNLPTPNFFGVAKIGEEVTLLVEHGKELAATLVNVGVISPNGTREVMFKLNGEFRAVSVVDDKAAPKETRPKANPHNDSQVGAPMGGKIVRVNVQNEAQVASGEALLALTAMKMELNISARIAGRVLDLQVKVGDTVEKGDLLLEIRKEK